MGNLKPDTSVFAAINNQPEFKEKIWQYLNRRVSDWRIQTGKEKLKEHGALLARIEKDTRRFAHGAAGAVGDRVRLRRPRRADAAPCVPIFPSLAALAWGEAAPPQILGTGADQRAAHRRARLVDAGGDARLLGRRHGSHPMDAGGLAQHGHGLRRRRPRVAVRPARRRARHRPRTISSAAASGAAASTGATR